MLQGRNNTCRKGASDSSFRRGEEGPHLAKERPPIFEWPKIEGLVNLKMRYIASGFIIHRKPAVTGPRRKRSTFPRAPSPERPVEHRCTQPAWTPFLESG